MGALSRFASYFDYAGDTSRQELVFLRDRSEEDWERVLRFGERRRLRAEETLISEGEIDRSPIWSRPESSRYRFRPAFAWR